MGSGRKNGGNDIKVELVFLTQMISMIPTDMDPFFVLTSVFDFCLCRMRVLKNQEVSFSLKLTAHRLSQNDVLLVRTESPARNQRLVCIAEASASVCTTCSLFHEGRFLFTLPLIASRRNGMKRVHSNSDNSITIYYRVNGHEVYI